MIGRDYFDVYNVVLVPDKERPCEVIWKFSQTGSELLKESKLVQATFWRSELIRCAITVITKFEKFSRRDKVLFIGSGNPLGGHFQLME